MLLEECMLGPSVQPTHVDVWLKSLLKDPKCEKSRRLANMSCYLLAGIGGYQSHTSGCEKNLYREADWTRYQEWPHRGAGGRNRWYVRFGSGPAASRRLGTVPDEPWHDQWRTYISPAVRGPDGMPDPDKLDKMLAPAAGLKKPAAATAGAHVAEHAAAPAMPPSSGAGSSTDVSVQPVPLLSLETDRSAAEDADYDREPSIFSVDPDELEARDKVARAPDTGEDVGEAKRQRRMLPIDQEGMDEAAEATAHRLRERRKVAMNYFRFRVFTDDKATHILL